MKLKASHFVIVIMLLQSIALEYTSWQPGKDSIIAMWLFLLAGEWAMMVIMAYQKNPQGAEALHREYQAAEGVSHLTRLPYFAYKIITLAFD